MGRIGMTILALVVLASVSAADDAARQESKQRMEHLQDLYNHDMNDSLISKVPDDLAFNREHGLWDNYYETWMHLVNTYVFMGEVNTGLKEVKLMHKDAEVRGDKYGLGLANYAMGNVYQNMGYLDEALECYRQSIRLVSGGKTKEKLNDIYSYYCDALNLQGQYAEMQHVTTEWLHHLERMTQEGDSAHKEASDVWYAYYYIACAQSNLGLDRLDEAGKDIDEAERRSSGNGEFIKLSVLYYRAQLFLQRKDYQKALELNTQRLEKSMGFDDKSSLVLIRQQRAEILRGLGRFEEAMNMYRDVSALTDSIYKKDTRTQINELNTLFRVSELDMEKRLEHTRAITAIAIVIAIALALIGGLAVWSNRRLRRKNEELAIARDQAQESSRMKSDFIKNISHEIRTPLNILSGFTQVVTQTDIDLPSEVRQEANLKILENTQRITTLINQLLALSESTSKGYIERQDTIGANALCMAAVSQSRVGDDPGRHFELLSTVDDGLTVQTSEYYATQALCHLLENAQKFTPEGGDIRLKCDAADGKLLLTVEDTGCGVPADKAEAIFGEFVQLDEYKEGVGIGLSLSRNIARRLGGDITLDTSYNGGARFVMSLPTLNRS